MFAVFAVKPSGPVQVMAQGWFPPVISRSIRPVVPWQAMEWAAHAMPDARFVRIAGGGHAPFIGHPDRVLDALLPFLGATPARELTS